MLEQIGMTRSKVIGLTGGIASGKSTVSAYLKTLNIPIVDADVVSRQVVEPGSAGLSKIVEAFGQEVLKDDQLNRKALRDIVFNDESKRLLLNSILHPIIHEKIVRDLEALKDTHSLVVFDAPLLIENNLMDMVDTLWVVSCSEAHQIERVMKRDGISKDDAKAIIDKQMPLKEKLTYADVVLNNDDTINILHVQIDQALKYLIQ